MNFNLSFCIPESFNKIISHQLFDHKITFVNSQHENEIQKVIFYSKAGLKRSYERLLITKINLSQKYIITHTTFLNPPMIFAAVNNIF